MLLTLVEGEEILYGHVDADYAGDFDHRFSTSGCPLSMFRGAVVWGSKKQTAVATSTVEAVGLAIKKASRLKGFSEEIGYTANPWLYPPWQLGLYCDNQGCIANLKNPMYIKFIKHVALRFHYARDAISKGPEDIRHNWG